MPKTTIKSRTRHPAQRTRERILRAACVLFAEKGQNGVSIRAIAERSRTNSALIYYHFGNKLDLYASVVQSILTPFFEQIIQIDRETGAPVEKLRRVVGAIIEFYETHPHVTQMLLHDLAQEGRQLRALGRSRILRPEVGMIVRGTIEEGIEQGLFRPIDPRQAQTSLIGMVLIPFLAMPFIEMIVDVPPESRSAFIQARRETVMDLFLHGILRRDVESDQDHTHE